MFDSDGLTGRLRACPLLGTWHALLSGDVIVGALDEAAAFFGGRITRELYEERDSRIIYAARIAVDRSLFLRSQAGLKHLCHQGRLEAI